jgi:hypothetical protein
MPNTRQRKNSNYMGFASSWLKEKALFPELIKEAPSENTEIIVVVPSYDEPGITGMLDSLAFCREPDCKVEVIVIVNAPDEASVESLLNNRKSILNIEAWNKGHPDRFFDLYVIDGTLLRSGGWSVGLARKTGMDEAVLRFDSLNKPYGIILNLDADCKVKSNYFTAIYGEMHDRKDRQACSIHFEHPISGKEFPENVYKAIILYELHLRYYFQGLAYSGFPYVHHTIGSAIAVKALSYVKAGGMNRRMAGEDFYFIQKLVPAGDFFDLNLTTVFPSPRLSSRVPFGTGVAISRLTEVNDGMFLTYNFQAFRELKALFSLIDKLFLCENDDLELAYTLLSPGIRQFAEISEWTAKIREIKKNTAGIQSFRKRFYGWFNMFRIVKYLNSTHDSFFEKRPVIECTSELLLTIGKDFRSNDASELLGYFRLLELTG